MKKNQKKSNTEGNMIFRMPEPPAPDPDHVKVDGEVEVRELKADGTWAISYFMMPKDLQDQLAEARAEWNKLKEAGTPYWCIHKDREVSHPKAYYKEDGYFRDDGIEMQWKHGVMCGDCGGYIQEG